ncbi:MAG: nuclear transport factor 2 family protein [Planctomycetota bacterium]
MSVEATKELDDFFRSLRQAYNSQDLKLYRAHFWTDKRFVHLDPSGRIDLGWGAYEELLDQEFRYMDKVTLELRELQFRPMNEFGSVTGFWKIIQTDTEGRAVEQAGRVSYTVSRMKDDWKVVHQHYSVDPIEE